VNSSTTANAKPSAGTPGTDAKPQSDKKPAVNKTAKSHADHDKKKRAEQRHTASNQHDNTPGPLAGRVG
jgi:hypothetical protein